MHKLCGWMLVGLAAAAGPAWAQGSAAKESTPKSRLQGSQIILENDLFGRGRSDRWFTNGLRYTRTYRMPREADPLSATAVEAGNLVLGAEVDKSSGRATQSVSWTLGQNIYTPRDITDPQPQRDDRPWVGWLYGGVTVQGYRGESNIFQQSDLKLGITGRNSGAQWVQRTWHDIIHSAYPAGWEQQARSRLGVQFSHMRLRRWGDDRDGDPERGDHFGFHVGANATVGTLRTYATGMAGMVVGSLRGKNPVFAVSNDGDLVIQDFGDPDAVRQWLGFVNVSITAVAYNYFLTGRAPYGGSSVRRKPWVGAWQWGLSAPLGRHWSVVFSHTSRSAEFSSNATRRDEGVQRWGTFTFNHQFY